MIGAARSAPSLARFALREEPFAAVSDTRFFYADPARQQTLGMLLHLAEYSEEWLLVTGPEGMGKSTVLAQFLAHADAHLQPCRINGGDATDGAQLFLRIAAAFGLDLSRQNDGNPLEQLRSHLSGLHAERIPLIAVDDAERLADDTLEIILHLANLEGDHGKLLRVVLFAAPSLQQRLAGGPFAALTPPHVLELRPLEEAEISRYLVHRMSIAGYEGSNPFDAMAVKRIAKESGGLPGAINRSADRFLREMAGGQTGSGAMQWRRRLLPSVAVAAAIIGVGVALQSLLDTRPAPPSVAPVAVRPQTQPPVARTGGQEPLVVNDGGALRTPAPPAEAGSTATPSHAGDRAGTAATQEAAPAIAPVPEEVTMQPTVTAEAAPPTGTAWLRRQNPEHFTLQLLAAGHPATVEQYLKGHPLPLPWAVVDTVRDGAPLHLLVAGSYASREEARAAAARLPGTQAWPRLIRDLPLAREPAGDPEGLKNGQWLATRQPNRYTLQLVAAEHRQSVLNELGAERLPGPTALFATERHGKPLYVAVYGDYPDERSAESAFAALPARLRQGAPLVREFGTLQKVLAPGSAPTPPAN